MADKKQNDKKPSAFNGVDTLFDAAAPKKEEKKITPVAQTPTEPAGPKKEDELALAPTEALHDFPDHPYTVDVADNDMAKLVDSIQREGLLERIVVQRRKEGGFEILSGHRRHRACQMLGLKEVPVIIKHGLTKDQAILLMVDANLKRENILPLDEAKALKMQLDAMNRMGKRDPNGKLKRTDEIIAQQINKNRMYVQRKVKLLDLTNDLKKAVNDKTLSETPAYEIAYLPAEVQALFYDWMQMEDRAPTVAQAIAVRQHQQELTKNSGKGKEKTALLTDDQIDRIMNGERLPEIFPPPPPEKEEPTQAEQGKAAGPQAPAGAASAQAEQGGASQPGAVADTKAIPFQTANTPNSEPSRASYNSAAPAPEPPAAQPAQQAQTAAEATKSYIRTEYMAELRKDNVILPKADIRKYAPGCTTNDEYVAAIKEALAKGQEHGAKAAEAKTPSPKNPIVTPATEIINRAEARETAEKAAARDAAKATTPPPTPKAPEPVKVDTKAPPPTPKAPEPVKVDTKAPAPAPKAPEPAKVESKTPAPAPKAPEPVKVDSKASTAPAAGAALPLPKPAEPAKDNSGTKALDDFLKTKPRPGKGKGPEDKKPGKTK